MPSEGNAGAPLPPVEKLLHEGQEVLVQILKDPMGSKGARLTTLLSIPSRFLVLMPFEKHVGVSARIEDETERSRLKGLLEKLVPELSPNWGVIARTAAEGADEDGLRQDLGFLTRLWASVNQQTQFAKPGHLVHGDLPLSMRILRDLLGAQVERIRIDSADEARRVQQFAKVFVPQAAAKIEAYAGHAPIFDLYGVEDELNRALERKVDLKSGGHLVIDQTEAMTTIDVNTGAFTGHRNLEETILKTNLEAAGTIARQLRLRNLGGIIIIGTGQWQWRRVCECRQDHRSAAAAVRRVVAHPADNQRCQDPPWVRGRACRAALPRRQSGHGENPARRRVGRCPACRTRPRGTSSPRRQSPPRTTEECGHARSRPR